MGELVAAGHDVVWAGEWSEDPGDREILALLAVSTAQADIIYVDDDAPLGGDGLSWNTAYQFLQDALANAVAGTEIRVAQGVYLPDQDEAGNVVPGDRFATFQLVRSSSTLAISVWP